METFTNEDIRLNFLDEGKRFKCRFIEPGFVAYDSEGKNPELLKKETIDLALETFIGKPLTPSHKDMRELGKIDKVYWNSEDGWFYAEGTIEDELAKKRIENGWGISCGYRVNNLADGGKYNNVAYKKEIKDIEFLHLALVTNPRYTESQIKLNAMNIIKFIKKIFVKENETAAETVDNLDVSTEVEINGVPVALKDLTAFWADAHKVNDVPAPVVEPAKDKVEAAPVAKVEAPVVEKTNEVPAPEVITAPVVKAPTAEEIKLNAEREIAAGLNHFNELSTRRDKFYEQIPTNQEDTSSLAAKIALGKKRY